MIQKKRLGRKVSLNILITSQFIAQVIGIVGIVGYMSYQSGQHSVQHLAEQLMAEVGKRVNLYVAQDLGQAMHINQMNVEMIENGEIQLDDDVAVDRLLWRQMMVFKTMSTIMVGQADGTFRFVGSPNSLASGTRRSGFSDPDRPERLYVTFLDQAGHKTEQVRILDPFPVQERPWYQAAQKSQGPGWSQPFQLGKQPVLTVNAYMPFYDDKDQFLGAFAVNLSFVHLQNFLETLDICHDCRVVLVDEEGELIADSTGGELFQLTGQPDEQGLYWGEFKRLKPTESDDQVIAAAAAHWQSLLSPSPLPTTAAAPLSVTPLSIAQTLQFQGISANPKTQEHTTQLAQEQYWLQLIPLESWDQNGIYPQWTIAVIIPKTEFMAEITANIRRTVIVCLVALGGAIASGIITSRRLTRSLLRLTQAIQALASGDFNQTLPSSRIQEVESLSTSFRQMMKSLQQAFIIRQNYQLNLEHQIAEKTASLHIELQRRKQIESQLRRVNEELREHAQTDSLTQIANRRQFTTVLKHEWQYLQWIQAPLSIILFDVDYFKRYNDYYGHPMGDECLFKLAQASQKCLRAKDLIARYGGEEFIILLPDTDTKGAIEVAERLQTSIGELNIPHETAENSNVITVSIGIASSIPPVPSMASIEEQTSLLPSHKLITQADQALYRAKQLGRNQFAVYENDQSDTLHGHNNKEKI